MYREFYGLNENPFSLTPDPHYLYLTPCHKEALAQLFYGVQERKGFMVLIGEVGMGKTLLLNWMLNMFSENDILSAYIFNPVMTAKDMFAYISADFGLECNSNSKSQFLMQLYNLLIDRFSQGKTTVLIVDEAQNLSFEILEELRMLTNLETSKEKLLQIVLSGQPELGLKLEHTSVRQLKQRIALRCILKPLTFEETRNYICTRLKIGGLTGKSPFDNAAIEKIQELSGGIPRIINNICDNAMLAGYAYDQSIIGQSIIIEVGRDLQLTQPNMAAVADPVFALTQPNLVPKQLSKRYNKSAPEAVSWAAYLSEFAGRFARFISRKERINLTNQIK